MLFFGKQTASGLVLAMLIAAAIPCRAEAPARARASAEAKEGGRLYDQGDYDGALAKFQQAYDAFPSPKIFYNFGLAYQGLAREAEALEAFERFLSEARDAPTAAMKAAEENVKALRARVPTLTIASDAGGASINVDGRLRGTTPQGKPLRLDKGPHQIVVELQGYLPFVHRLELKNGDEITVRAELKQVASAGAATADASVARPQADVAVTATPERPSIAAPGSGSHAGQLGFVIGSDVGVQRPGAVLVPGVTYGVSRWIELEVAALIGPYLGGWAGGQAYFLEGSVKPGLVLGLPLFRVGGDLVAGVQVGPRLQWDVGPHFGAFVDLTAAWFPGANADLTPFWFVPRLGIQARL